jgi:hypothetical protein
METPILNATEYRNVPLSLLNCQCGSPPEQFASR